MSLSTVILEKSKNGKIKGEKKMIYSCAEHVDIAIDTVVNEHETFPILEQVSDEEKLSTTCEYCKNPAIYMVANK